jgi:flagellar biogenesis protein FliO
MTGDTTLQPLLVIVVCVGLAGAFFWLRKKGFVRASAALQRRGSTMRVIERVHLTPQHSLHLVSLGSRTILVAASPSNCQILDSSRGGDQ